jgi:hypothetical protein
MKESKFKRGGIKSEKRKHRSAATGPEDRYVCRKGEYGCNERREMRINQRWKHGAEMKMTVERQRSGSFVDHS